MTDEQFPERRGGGAPLAGGRGPGAQEAVLTGVLSGGMAVVVLSFCAGILLDIVDALFVCYATDRCPPLPPPFPGMCSSITASISFLEFLHFRKHS